MANDGGGVLDLSALANVLQSATGSAQMLQNRNERDGKPRVDWEFSSGEDGQPRAKFEMDAETALNIHRAMENYGQIIASMQQEVGRIQQQEERQRRGLGPLMTVLSQVSGELAAGDKRLPPVVSALGRANLALNPPPQALQAQKMGILQAMGDVSGRQVAGLESGLRLGMEQRRIGIEGARLEETKAENLRRESRERIQKFNQETRLIAQKGGGPLSPDAFTALARTRGLKPEEIEDAYIAHQEEASIVTKGQEAAKERTQEVAKTKADLYLRNRITALHESFALQTSPTKMAFQTQLHRLNKDIDNAAMSDRELKVIGQKDLQKLTQANATDAYVDKVEYMFNQPEWKAVAGPVFQFNPSGGPNGKGEFKINPQAALPKAFQNIPRTEADSMISHEIPRLLTLMLNGQAGGASILRIEAGQKLIRDMGVTGAVRPDQIQAIMKIVRDTNNENKAAVMRTHTGVDWSKRKWLLSSDTPANRTYFYGRKTSWGAPVQPIPDLGGAEDTSGVTSGGFEEWKRQRATQ